MILAGPLLGLASLAVIGLGFFWVVKAEYALGLAWWLWFALAGLLLVGSSLLVGEPLLSALLGMTGASGVWGSTELKAQALRVERGWYPANPRPKPRPPLESLTRKLKAPSL